MMYNKVARAGVQAPRAWNLRRRSRVSLSERLCTVDGCEGKHDARGFCLKHYVQFRRAGTLDVRQIHNDDLARFLSHVKKTDKCWLWLACTDRKGYGQFRAKGKMAKAHRFSYELFKGKIPKGLFCLHSCDVPSCVNPAHLWLGSDADNVRDMILKGRGRAARGSAQGSAKLTEKQVLEIRHLLAKGLSTPELGRQFGVDRNTIWLIGQRKTWRHV